MYYMYDKGHYFLKLNEHTRINSSYMDQMYTCTCPHQNRSPNVPNMTSLVDGKGVLSLYCGAFSNQVCSVLLEQVEDAKLNINRAVYSET